MRIQLVISEKEIAALDEWRAQHKIWSRSEAIRRLVSDGIKHEPTLKESDQNAPLGE